MVIYVFAFTLGKPHYEKSEAILKFCETVLKRIQENFSYFYFCINLLSDFKLFQKFYEVVFKRFQRTTFLNLWRQTVPSCST